MKAAVIERVGTQARYSDFPDPEPTDGETVSQVLAAGIHPIVRGLAAGGHYHSEGQYPLVPGVDCVARGGDGLARYAGFIRSPWGTMAELVATRMGFALPDGADPVAMAGTLNPGLSSWLPLVVRARELGSLGTVLILGTTGVAGRIAVQNAFALGAERVVGIGRDEVRLAEVRRLGGIPVTLADGPPAVSHALAGTAPSLVLDYLWGSAAEVVWDALGKVRQIADDTNIVHVEIGTAAGERAAVPGELLRSRRFTVRGSGAGSTPLPEIIAQLPVFIQRVAAGEVVAPIEVFPLSRVDEAWGYAGPRRAVVVPD